MSNAIKKSKALIEAMLKVRKTPCVYNKTLYEEDKALFNCQSSTNVYHCIKNDRKSLGDICIQPIWFQPSKYFFTYVTGYIIADFTLI